MGLKRVELAPGVYHLQGGSNMGLVVQDGRGLLVDSGLDKDAARRALRLAEEAGAELAAIFITHAHADHFGGAYLVQRRTAARLYAPALEGAMMEHPILEPLYLFGGAAPIGELRHKFTLAKPCRVDSTVEAGPQEMGSFQVEVVPLPGHSPNQMGLAVGEVLFCADALFPAATLAKHGIPFCSDLDAMLATLARLPEMEYAYFAPGHGPAYRRGAEIAAACAANRERLTEIRVLVYDGLTEPRPTGELVRAVADHFGLRLAGATFYLLAQTTILAALASLERAGEVAATVEGNRLLWRRTAPQS